MPRISTLLAAMVFGVAVLLAGVTAYFAAIAIEARSVRSIERLFEQAGLDWANVAANGLLVTLSGVAPTEALRFRAISLAGRVVDQDRVIDALDVMPPDVVLPPQFRLEFLRNDDGISLIGLSPEGWDHRPMLAALGAILADTGGDGDVTDMIETADYAVPPGWVEAVGFATGAMKMLPRSKISVSPWRVDVTAISESAEQKSRIEAHLARSVPGEVSLSMTISAPRPVITPFTLRFVIDDAGARFDACSASEDRGRTRILRAAVAAGVMGKVDCTLGLGVPSPRWADGVIAGIEAVAELGAATVTFSDADVTLIAEPSVSQALFDRVVGDLTARLPDSFSLKATLLPPVAEMREVAPVQFTATRSPEGNVQLRGRLSDERSRAAVDAFARARFPGDQIYTAARLDPEGLPVDWAIRVLAGISALAQLENGAVLVEAARLEVRGVTGSADARAEVARLLSDRLGQGAEFRVDVTYDERLDPATLLPTPEECVNGANAILQAGKITFAPGSAEIDAPGRSVIRDLAEVLRDCIDIPMEVGGHTDSQGRAETNMTLSEARAEAVRRALRDLRIPVGNLVARGYGADEPIADNATEAGREANRRITFSLRLRGDAARDLPADTATLDDGASEGPDGAETGVTDPEADDIGIEAQTADPVDRDTVLAPEMPDGDLDATPTDDEQLSDETERSREAAAEPDPAPLQDDSVEADGGADAEDEHVSFAPQEKTIRPGRRPADKEEP